VAPYPCVRFIPHRHSCLPGLAHAGPPPFYSTRTVKFAWSVAVVQSLRVSRAASRGRPRLPVIRFTARNWLRGTCNPEGNFGGNQRLVWFDESFAPMPGSGKRFARQYCGEPPPAFPLASLSPGIVHHLSGFNVCTRALALPASTKTCSSLND